MGDSTVAIVILVLLTVIWIVILIPVCRDMLRLDWLKKNGIITSGKIVEYIKTDYSDGPMYTPVIEFTTPNNQINRFKSSPSASSTEPVIGEQVTLLYCETNPKKVIIYDMSIKTKGLFLILFIGVILLAIWIGFASQGFIINPSK